MKKQNGITLIALVISIIVMLILAGVSINAIVGENGVLSRAQYSSFMNEMSAVEEAVQLWKAGELIESKGQVSTAIPANGLCKVNDLTATERLVGEIGYYRTWSIGGTMPSTNILSSADTFNSSFESEFIFYPAGVQDLYYLNNEALGLKDDKVYLIDASTSMVYSMTGITLNGVRCYSTYMAKAVTGNNAAPIFAAAEVSGTGTGEVLAGNISSEYLTDENGEYILDEDGEKILNPDYNPNGFKIVSDYSNKNIYKIYNNGDVFCKGEKGTPLNTSQEEMQNINAGIFQKLTFPGEIIGKPGNLYYNEIKAANVKIIYGNQTIFILNQNGELWAWGDNSNNKLGLTQEQQIEYTGREVIKLNVDGKKVKKVFQTGNVTFCVTDEENPSLFAAGANTDNAAGILGLGHSNSVDTFQKVEFDNPENIIKIQAGIGDYKNVIILCNDNRMYCSGYIGYIFSGLPSNTITNFTPIFDGKIGDNIASEIEDFEVIRGLVLLKKDKSLWSKTTNFWCWRI